MKIRLGYAVIPVTLESSFKTLNYTNYKKMGASGNIRLKKIIDYNLDHLLEVLKYNVLNKIYFYRFTHNIIPLATHDDVAFDYINPFLNKWQKIGAYIKKHNIRVDTHPDQYCVLNSLNEDVIKMSIKILECQYQIFKAMKINSMCVLHIGSGKPNKEEALLRFKQTFIKLPNHLKQIIMLENDDRVFNVLEVLSLSEELKIPFVFDYHHNRVNPSTISFSKLLPRIIKTWSKTQLNCKMHISTPKDIRHKISHHNYISLKDFLNWLEIVKDADTNIDLMLECKMKDDALLRLIRQLKFYTKLKITKENIIEL